MGGDKGKLQGKVALVTGASRGIGEQVALLLARDGADVALCSTEPQGCEQTASAIRALGRRAVAVQADIGTPEGVERVVKAAEQLGPVEVLVNNAAIAPRVNLDRMELDVLHRVLAVNLVGPYALCHRLVPPMVSRGYGRVVNVSSISGTLGTPGFTAYCASKWGLNGFTQALSEELRDSGVFVAAVLPGTVRTRQSAGLGFPVRMEPEDVGELIRYLCAEAPAAMRGSLVEMFG